MTSVFIMCAGKQTRWPVQAMPKQLLSIGQESILQRQIRQVKRAAITPTVVTQHAEIKRFAELYHCPVFEPPHKTRYWLIEDILKTSPLWQDHLIVLLGDVIFSRNAIERILGDQFAGIHIYGNGFECFALSAEQSAYQNLRHHLQTAIDFAESHEDYPGAGKLWTVYRTMVNAPLDQHKVPTEKKVFEHIDDLTQDMDTPERYRKFREMILANGNLDDLP